MKWRPSPSRSICDSAPLPLDKPEVVSGLLRVFLRAVETTVRQRSPGAPPAARCWALLLVRIYECLPLLCPRCSQPMRIVAFIHDPPVIERILFLKSRREKRPGTTPAMLKGLASRPWTVGQVLAARIMSAQTAWNHDALFDYTDRYVAEARRLGLVDWQRIYTTFSRAMWDTYR